MPVFRAAVCASNPKQQSSSARSSLTEREFAPLTGHEFPNVSPRATSFAVAISPAAPAKVSDPKKPRKLPSALVANAKRATLVARREKTARIKTLLASIRDRKRTLVGAYWDIGRDLAELRAMHAEVLLEYASFSALCKAECGLSDAFVAGAIRVAKELSREAAIDLGSQRRAVAFLDLARVTPEDDTATELLKKGLARGKVRLPTDASARKVEQATKAVRAELRAKTPGGKGSAAPRGNTTTPAERALATRLQSRLSRSGFKAEVHAVATRPGKPAVFALRNVPHAAFEALGQLLLDEA